MERWVEMESLARVCLTPTQKGPSKEVEDGWPLSGPALSPMATAGLGVGLGQEAHARMPARPSPTS